MARNFSTVFVAAAMIFGLSAQRPLPTPPQPKPPQNAPQPCDTRDSADYVPGVDAYGRPVAPADVPSGTDIVVSREIYVEPKTNNPQLKGAGVTIRMDSLGAPPACQPAPKKPVH